MLSPAQVTIPKPKRTTSAAYALAAGAAIVVVAGSWAAITAKTLGEEARRFKAEAAVIGSVKDRVLDRTEEKRQEAANIVAELIRSDLQK